MASLALFPKCSLSPRASQLRILSFEDLTVQSQGEEERNMNGKNERSSGFTTIEMAAVCTILLLVSGIAVVSLQSFLQAYRTGADARMIASQLSQARMRASSLYTRVRLSTNTANRTYQIEVMTNKTAGTYQVEGGQGFLSQGVTFGLGGVSTPAGEQTAIAQSTEIIFNSRGIPITAGGVPTSNYALYLTNGEALIYAVTVSMTGNVATWQYLSGAWVRL
jgi:Tfp pilus assembly protein FimT